MKIVLGFILCLYISVSTHFVELAKLPLLYSHYLEHKKEEKNLSFSAFLALHYNTNSGHSDSKHSNLPFKSNNENTVVSFPMPLNELTLEVSHAYDIISIPLFFFYKSKYTFHFLTAIWQPPRI